MPERITVMARSGLIVSKTSKRTYFTIEDQTQRKLLCFNPTQYNDFAVGTEVEVNVTPGKMADDTARVELADAGKTKPAQIEGREPAPREISGQEIGLWWKELGSMLRAGDIDKTKPEGKLLRTAYYTKMLEVLDIKIRTEKVE